MTQDNVDSIVTHLTPQDVGVESVEDLVHVTSENMETLNLAPIQLKKLMIAFKNCGPRATPNTLQNNESKLPNITKYHKKRTSVQLQPL